MTPTTSTTSTTTTTAQPAAEAAAAQASTASAAAAGAASPEQMIVFEDVSKFYGEILGVNRVNLQIAPGITSLVGPNGSGKTTLMNLMTGLIRPTRGRIGVLGTSADEPETLFRKLGYCSQFDSFPRGATAREFVEFYLRVHGYTKRETELLAHEALERVSMTDAADRKISAFSKGMRQCSTSP